MHFLADGFHVAFATGCLWNGASFVIILEWLNDIKVYYSSSDLDKRKNLSVTEGQEYEIYIPLLPRSIRIVVKEIYDYLISLPIFKKEANDYFHIEVTSDCDQRNIKWGNLELRQIFVGCQEKNSKVLHH